MDLQLRKNIIATITYYDVFDFPLTSFEIWKHLVALPTEDGVQKFWRLDQVIKELETDEIKEYILNLQGFYLLHGRKKLVENRRKRELISIKKIKKLKKYSKYLKMVPFIVMIALTGNLSYKNGNEDSDLDVLIVCKYGHLWTGRFLMTVVTHLFGIRMWGDKHANRVCLNYYITDKSLEVPTKDLFAAHEYSFIMPMYGMDVFKKFAEENSWIRNYKPHYQIKVLKTDLCEEDSSRAQFVRNTFESIFNFEFIENYLKKIQQKKIKSNPKTEYKGAIIEASDKYLIFLPKPHGPKVFEEYKKRLTSLELPWRV